MRNGLTMIELLLALSLLSALVLVIASWTQVAAQASARGAAPMRWRPAAEAVLNLIHDDIACGDFTSQPRRRGAAEPHVEAVDGVLLIRTRAGGAVTNRYVFDSIAQELRLEQSRQGRPTVRPLIRRVAEWDCRIDTEGSILAVSITSDTGDVAVRSYLVP